MEQLNFSIGKEWEFDFMLRKLFPYNLLLFVVVTAVSSLFTSKVLAFYTFFQSRGYIPWTPAQATFYFSTSLSFPSDVWEDKIRLSQAKWFSNAFRFVEVNTPDSSVTNQGSVVYAAPTIASSLGETTFIQFASPPNPNPSRFRVLISNNKSFYLGVGRPPNTQYDLQSVATHEFGHAALLDHPDKISNTICPKALVLGDPLRFPTMCSSIAKQETYHRTLSQDDRNGIADLYPIAAKLGSKVDFSSAETAKIRSKLPE